MKKKTTRQKISERLEKPLFLQERGTGTFYTSGKKKGKEKMRKIPTTKTKGKDLRVSAEAGIKGLLRI